METTPKTAALGLWAVLVLLMTVPAMGAQAGPRAAQGIAPNIEDPQRLPSHDARYTIQVGAFKKRSGAETKLSQLAAQGCQAFYRYEDTGAKGMWFRVYTGRYATKPAAREAAARLKGQGVFNWYLIRKLDPHGDDRLADGAPASDRSPAVRLEASPSVQGNIHIVGPERGLRETPPPAAAAQADGASPQGPESNDLRLTLLDAMLYSMEGNREIQVVAFAPQQSREDVVDAEAFYDSRLFADASYRRYPNLESSVVDVVTEDEGLTQTGLRKQLKTGGSTSIYLETRYSELNNAEFQRKYKHIIAPTLELRQPLLNNIGAKEEQTAIQIANYQTHISQEEFRETVIAVTNRVAKVYWKLYLYKELIGINRGNLAMAEEVHRREAERLDRGLSQELDVARARSNVQQRRSVLLKSREEYLVAMDRLKLLLNWEKFNLDSDYTVVPVESPQIEPLVVNADEAIATALANRSEILKVKQEQMIRQADENLAAHQRLPTLDAYGRYSISGYGRDFEDAREDIGINDENAWEVGINFEWPIGNRAANARYRKKVLERRQVEALMKRIEDDIKLDVKQILHSITTARGEIEAARLARDAAAKVVEGEFTRFDIGQTSNLELLRAQDLLALTNRSYTRAVVNYNIALHELERAQGVLPRGITIEKNPR